MGYPENIINLTNPVSTDSLNTPLSHSGLHIEVNNEIEAIETELGIGLKGSLVNLVTRLAVGLNEDGTLIETDPIFSAWDKSTGISIQSTQISDWSSATASFLTSISSLDITTALGYTPVTNERTLTINGTSYDLSANRSWSISAGSGGYASNVYLTNTQSTTYASYKALSYVNDESTTEQSVTVNNEEEIIQTYLFDTALGITLIDAGNWSSSLNVKVSSASGNITIKFELFKRNTSGDETTLFSKYSEVVANTSYDSISILSTQGEFSVSSTDKLGVRIYAKNTVATDVTVYMRLGDDTATWFNTPLATRHGQLRDLTWTLSEHTGDSNSLAAFDSSGIASYITDNSSNWNTAYGWGNHADEGYAVLSLLTLDSLSDVFVSSGLLDGQLLKYDSNLNVWLNWTHNFSLNTHNHDGIYEPVLGYIPLAIDGSNANTDIDVDTYKITANDFIIPNQSLGTPTYSTINDFCNSFGSAGRKTGGVISDATGGYVAVTAGTGFIKATDDDNTQLMFFDFPAPSNIQIPSASTRYIGVEYNSGTPQVVARTTFNWDLDTEFPLGRVINEVINGTDTLYIYNSPWWVTDGTTNIIQAIRSFGLIRRDATIGGLSLSVTGTRNISVTSGTVWSGLNDYAFTGLDTSSSGTFHLCWYKSGEGWQESDATQYSITQWNDVTQTTLQTIDNNKYCNIWVYGELDEATPGIAVIYPQAQYNTAAEAEAKKSPDNLPTHIRDVGILLGRIIIKQNTATPISVQSAFTTMFSASVVTDHGNLSGLSDDDHTQYWIAGTARTGNFETSGSLKVGSFENTINSVTGTTQALEVNKNYLVTGSSKCTLTLPSTASIGQKIEVTSLNTAGYRIAQNANQYIRIGNQVTTTGTGGYVENIDASSNIDTYSKIVLECIVANNGWMVTSNFTYFIN